MAYAEEAQLGAIDLSADDIVLERLFPDRRRNRLALLVSLGFVLLLAGGAVIATALVVNAAHARTPTSSAVTLTGSGGAKATYEAGRKAGYAQGLAAARSSSKNASYNLGLARGQRRGFRRGLKAGKDAGYRTGYSQGVHDTSAQLQQSVKAYADATKSLQKKYGKPKP